MILQLFAFIWTNIRKIILEFFYIRKAFLQTVLCVGVQYNLFITPGNSKPDTITRWAIDLPIWCKQAVIGVLFMKQLAWASGKNHMLVTKRNCCFHIVPPQNKQHELVRGTRKHQQLQLHSSMVGSNYIRILCLEVLQWETCIWYATVSM